MSFTTCIHITFLKITNSLFQFVNKHMTHTYYTVTRIHVEHSYGQALIYIYHTYRGPLLSQELPNNNIARSLYYAAQKWMHRLFWGSFFIKDFTSIERGCNEIS